MCRLKTSDGKTQSNVARFYVSRVPKILVKTLKRKPRGTSTSRQKGTWFHHCHMVPRRKSGSFFRGTTYEDSVVFDDEGSCRQQGKEEEQPPFEKFRRS